MKTRKKQTPWMFVAMAPRYQAQKMLEDKQESKRTQCWNPGK